VRAGEEDGFTLIETLVAISTGIVIVFALFAILEFSVGQSSRINDVATATQLGRVAMNRIVDELHSVCLSQNFAPVEAESTENSLIFVNGYSEGAEIPSVGTSATGVRKDKIEWNSSTGLLTDYVYYATGESNGNYTFSETASPATGVRIGEHVTQLSENGKQVPIFRYYAYGTTPATSTTAAASELNETTLIGKGESLSKAAAESVASVAVSFNMAPSDGKETQGRPAPLTSQAIFGFEAPSNETTTKTGPCQ
jgi:Tfp pilus assembly protein PilW